MQLDRIDPRHGLQRLTGKNPATRRQTDLAQTLTESTDESQEAASQAVTLALVDGQRPFGRTDKGCPKADCSAPAYR